MKKREQGILTVEASIVLTLMLLFILFLFSFGRVYRAQNLISHATLQSADAIAMESYLRETALQSDVSDVVHLASHITDSNVISAEGLESLRSANLPKIARQKFIAAIANSEANADEKLRSMGIKDGLAGVDFSECKMDLANDDVIVAIKYTIEMQFPVFGFNEITVTKAAKAKTFGEILFEVSTQPNNPGWGSTSGDDKVVHGSTVQILATPKYGYKFVSWNDGVTDNPRTVTVTDAQHYIAIFEKDSFGVNLSTKINYNTTYAGIQHSSYGSVSGAGNYLYLDNVTITATPTENYQFVGWDLNGDGIVDDKNSSITVTVDKTYDIKAIFKPAPCTVTANVNNASYGSAIVQQGSKRSTTIEVEYGSEVQLIATTKDSVNYIFDRWNNNETNPSYSITVKEDITYEAIFITNTYTVNFYNGSSIVHTTTVIRESSILDSKKKISSAMPSSNPSKSGATFDKWEHNGSEFNEYTQVYGDIDVLATWKYTVTLDANGGSIFNSSSKSYTVSGGDIFNFSDYTPSKTNYDFNGWYREGSKYSGSTQIDSSITVVASWSCTHPNRYEYKRTGNACDGGTIYYRCTQCHADLGSSNYGGRDSHVYSLRCDTKHYVNYFNGYGSGGCGYYHCKKNSKYDSSSYNTYSLTYYRHSGKPWMYCKVCKYCYQSGTPYFWCGTHAAGKTGVSPTNGHQRD